jgi:hypothetical protein
LATSLDARVKTAATDPLADLDAFGLGFESVGPAEESGDG